MNNKTIKSRVASLENYRSEKQTIIVLMQDTDNPDLFRYENGENTEIMTRAEADRRFSDNEYLVILICYEKSKRGQN